MGWEPQERLEFFLDELVTGMLEKLVIRFSYCANFLIISKSLETLTISSVGVNGSIQEGRNEDFG
jgi:hypothetical protein